MWTHAQGAQNTGGSGNLTSVRIHSQWRADTSDDDGGSHHYRTHPEMHTNGPGYYWYLPGAYKGNLFNLINSNHTHPMALHGHGVADHNHTLNDHTHPLSDHNHTVPDGNKYNLGGVDNDPTLGKSSNAKLGGTGTGNQTAENNAHENMPPYYALIYIIKQPQEPNSNPIGTTASQFGITTVTS